MKQNLSLIRGDSKNYIIRFRDVSGSPLILTGATITLTIKNSFNDPDINAILQKNAVLTDPTHGVATIILENSDTQNLPIGCFHYDIQYENVSHKIYTIVMGIYKIIEDVTRSV